MKKWLLMIVPLLLWACVGQKEDPEPEPEPEPEIPEVPGGSEEGSQFFHRVLALEFTATWCQYCPNMHEALEEAAQARPDRFVEVALHQNDEMSPAEADGIVKLFKVSSFPAMVFDWDISTRFNQQESARMTKYLDSVMDQEVCGIAVETKVENDALQVDVKVKAVEEGQYAIYALLVQDHILANQAGAGENYSCESVLRKYLGDGYDGTQAKTIAAGEEAKVTFTAEAPSPVESYRVVAYVLKDGKSQNATSCALNAKTEYRYEKND